MAETSLDHIKALIDGQGRESKAHWEGLRREIGARFDAVDDRLCAIDDKQAIANGRVTAMELALGLADERIGHLHKADVATEARITEIDRKVLPVLEEAAFAHRRKTDPTAVAVLHGRDSDQQKTLIESLIEKTAVRYGSALVAGAGFLKFIEWFVREVVK